MKLGYCDASAVTDVPTLGPLAMAALAAFLALAEILVMRSRSSV